MFPFMARRRQSIITTLKQRIPKGERVLVALSGGKDSSVLLHGLLKVRRLLDIHVEACHVDHGLRKESGEDAAFVSQMCEKLGVVCHVVRLGKRPAQSNMEAWARAERYRALKEVMERESLSLLVTAHNANDVAETLLMRLFANKELTTIEESDRRRRCLRPLLGVSREQIEEFVIGNRVPFVEDPSNADTAMVRNRVRKKVLPLLERDFDPSMVWILSERAQSIAADCEALQYVAEERVDRIGEVVFKDRAWLDRCRKELASLPYAIKWRVVQALFTPILGYTVGEPRARTLALFLEGAHQSLDLGGGTVLVTAKGAPGINLRS
jgi:tRNA(Ile)-lysidine synthetase-like protein